MVIAVLFITFFALLFINVPIGFSIIIASLGSMLLSGNSGFTIIQSLQTSAASSSLLAIPFFVTAGLIMDRGGIIRLLLDFANAVVGHIKGGLSLVNVLSSMLFSGISGSSVADTASIGSVLIPAMREKKYDMGFTAAITASSGTLGAILPPSIPMVILGLTANVSIGSLFLAGIIPGILMGVAMLLYAYYYSVKQQYPTEPRVPLGQVVIRLFKAIIPLFTVVIIIAGIVGGVFTPTEAGAIACVYALFLGMFVYKKIKILDLPGIFLDGAKITATVMIVVIGASVFGKVLTYERIPQMLVDFLITITDNQYLLLLLITLLLLVLGTFLDPTPIILLVAPILFPVILQIGIDPIHFGMIFIITMAIGQITPPVGVVLFTAQSIAKIPIEQIIRSLVPLWGVMIVILLLVIFIPAISTTIPNHFNL
ncbi:TRAP transporter large permease [Oceanobacillus sp. CFH 90083]|uniref:TRAP transporter large permease n=1 Tax=Oceanobacillus sp. CFH 90083 TaxID=2592336 RepID=UPI00128E22DB|nr:TRAP transporter large permease [Oceanobacillus sp. CFH 90083]